MRRALAVLIIALSGCSASGERSRTGLVELPCDGAARRTARCYSLTVPERRGEGATTREAGRIIRLRIVVLPASDHTHKAADPIFFLAGGPGQAATEILGDPGITGGAFRSRRDLVFVDQRGTGGSHRLDCRFYGPAEDAQSFFDDFMPIERVRRCREELARDADLTQYTTAASVADLEDVRAALGYGQINLSGGSYGTRLAMEYVRRYEANVRTVMLDGAVPPSVGIPATFGWLAQRALDDLLTECGADSVCAAAFPQIRDETRAVFERLERGPVRTTIGNPPIAVTISRDNVAEAIRYMTYSSRHAARVPLYLHQAFSGNYAPIAEYLRRHRGDGTFDGLYLSITCTEDVPRVPADAADREQGTYLGGYRVRQQRAACGVWPGGPAPSWTGSAVASQVPALITSGVLDPVTPPENGDEVARTLPNSLHVRIPSGDHSPEGLANLECIAGIKQTFIDQ
ncbi:MAG: alpha/beta hydrolase, partial [Acidobacteria bacterium]|nr:alpha/beta hydrolase [Acidobacteriota bacterium]